jgi:hypothetical protein
LRRRREAGREAGHDHARGLDPHGCGPNTVGHDLHFDHNDATSNDISGNTIQHDLNCDKNAALTGGGNTVGGKKLKQCAGF